MANTLIYEDFLALFPDAQQFANYLLVPCPFHDDNHPSLMIFRDGWFRCLGAECRRNGRWVTLWNKLHGQPVQVHPEYRTHWAGPKMDEPLEDLCWQAHLDLLRFDSFRWYLEMRHVDGRIESNELGYWDGWYTFPVRDEQGDFITAILRAAPHVQEVTKMRYICRHEPRMFVPDWRLFRRMDYVLVVYGAIDALAMSDMRLPVCTSTAGNLSFKADWLDDQRKPIVILPDKGEETVAAKLASDLGWRAKVLRMDFLPEGMKDPADAYANGRGEELVARVNSLLSMKRTTNASISSKRTHLVSAN